MSELVSSMMGNSLSAEVDPAATNPLSALDPQQKADGSTFPQLFASIDPETAPTDDSLLTDVINPFAPMSLVTGTNLPNSVGMVVTGLAGQNGNVLPQNMPSISISGFIAQADQRGAAAVSFAGDGQQMLMGTPQLATGLAPAVQLSQMQLHEGLPQPLQNPQIDLQNIAIANQTLAGQNRLEMGKQIEMLAEMTTQTDAVDETLLAKPMTTTGFAQLLSNPIAQQEASSVLATASRSMEPMTATLQQPHWNEQIGDRLNLMISRGLQQAAIRLNPPELGMLDVKINIQGDQANVNFTTPHSQVKEALDAAIPRLREMLEENGLTLGDVNVSHQSLAQGQSQSGDDPEGQSANRSDSLARDQLASDSKQNEKDITISGEIGLLDVFV